jgi:Zn finger protein HypA/HybF involved in hydrogenase expression
MNELSKFLVESIMEDENPIKKTVVIYVGRFQPMHKGHYGTYQHLVKKFGKDNVFVGTSDKVEKPKSPFNFKEKVKIATTMFGIPKSKIFKVKNPYKPTEILKKFDEETTAFVTVVGMKDKNRLGGKYFQPYKGEPSVGYRDGGYVYAAPQSGGGISGTETRNGLSVGSDEQKQNFFKKRAYGKFNATIFKMITDKLDEGIEISKDMIEEWLINESSKSGIGQSDDGPNVFFPNYDVFSRINVDRAKRIGYEVVNMITNKELEDYYDHPIYPDGPVKAVTPFPAGVLGTQTATNQVDIYSSDAYSKWFKHVTRKAALVGYELVKGLDTTKDTKDASLDSQKGDKKSQEEYEASLNENIVLPVKVGDTIMTGRFKNKKTVIKSIGKDEHGMPTINGRKVVTFRMVKEGFVSELAGTAVKCEKCNHSWDIESEDDEKYLCHSCGWDSQKQEYDFDAFDSWQEKMGLSEDVDIDERSKGKLRPADLLRRKAAMAGKRAQIARRRKRTMMRKKPLSKLKKIAYKKAYLQVYDEFREELFPGIAKKDLSIQQAKIVHKNVMRKKGRVLKRARFRFLPQLRDAEAQKFTKKEGEIKEEVNDFFYMDFKKYVYKNRKQINQKIKGLSPKQKKKFLELLWKKQIGKGFGKDADGVELHKMLKKDKVVKEGLKESILTEGGAYGHMSHPFDTDINLTFGQLKDIVNRALEGTLEFTREKTDGQALAISWRDGRLVAARNKGHLKNRGENALDIKGVSDKFQGRGGLSDAYNYAMKDLSNAIKSLSDKQRDKIFKQGACFMNLEVIYPTSVNVIPYGQALLVFHGTMEFNEEGVAIGENGDAARILAGMIKQVNKDVQDSYTIKGPPVVKLPKSQDLTKKRSKYSSQISKLQKEFSLKDTDGVANYHQAWWEQWVDKNSPSSLDNKTKMGLVKRWAFMDKGFRLDKKNITDEKTLEWAKKTDKDDQKKIGKKNLMKFEQIFLGLGAEVLKFTSSALTVNPDSAVRDMKKRIDKTIKDVKKSGDPKKIEKLKLELGRLNSIGGSKKIVPNEGIVFLYKGNTFKLTGTFASVNQILGIFF